MYRATVKFIIRSKLTKERVTELRELQTTIKKNHSHLIVGTANRQVAEANLVQLQEAYPDNHDDIKVQEYTNISMGVSGL